MKNVAELARFIRFRLGELRAENKHHEFEHLARQFARLRICGRILPATGPVGAGGDQARDFESYKTYLESTPIATSTFIGLAQDKKLVFGCSLQVKDIGQKIKGDVKTICDGPEKVDAVYYFCEADVPVAKRHELQNWSYKLYETELEILDGQALSEQLTDLDVFWIAIEYLSVPSNQYPRITTPDSSYDRYREHWLTDDEKPLSYADFFQVKHCLRMARFESSAKPDLVNWIRKMEEFLTSSVPDVLRRRATYEICVAAWRGLNNLTARRELVESYFSRIEELEEVSEIQDAVTLFIYCSTAHSADHFDIEAGKLNQWMTSLIQQLESDISGAASSSTRCRLYQMRGSIAITKIREGATKEGILNEVFDWWFRLIEEVASAPLFPLESFADQLTIAAPIAGDHERYLKLTQRTDELLASRSGGHAAAKKCKDRAMAHYSAEQYLSAVKQLHNAKVKWFSAETIRGSLLSMLVLSYCYLELQLIYPAKYYAASVAFLAHQHDDESIKDLLPSALHALARTCYLGGEWLTFALISKWTLFAHSEYEVDPADLQRHQGIQQLCECAAIVRTVTRRCDTSLADSFDEFLRSWPVDREAMSELESQFADDSSAWQTIPIDELWERMQDELADRPFCELGERRQIRWKALGITWTVEFDNEYITSAISEEFVSTLQIILADLTDRDLVLLPIRVLIHTCITNESKCIIEEVPDNDIATWRIGFPESWITSKDAVEDVERRILSLAVTALWKCSVLDNDSFNGEIEQAFSHKLGMKVFCVRPYAELYLANIPEGDFTSPNRSIHSPLLPEREFEVSEHNQLAWMDGDGPGYSKERAEEFLQIRYDGIMSIRWTLPRLLESENFRGLIRGLRREGYLDWEILSMVSSICIDYRLSLQLPPNASPEEQAQAAYDLQFREENDDDPEIPLSLFSEERIDMMKRAALAAIPKTWGLELRWQTPDFDALERLLDVRYHNSEDDIPHAELFPGT